MTTAASMAKGEILAELDITPDLWFLRLPLPGDPVMPGCWGWMPCGNWSASSWAGRRPGKGRALGVGEVKFTGRILPTAKKVTYKITFKRVINRKSWSWALPTAW